MNEIRKYIRESLEYCNLFIDTVRYTIEHSSFGHKPNAWRYGQWKAIHFPDSNFRPLYLTGKMAKDSLKAERVTNWRKKIEKQKLYI